MCTLLSIKHSNKTIIIYKHFKETDIPIILMLSIDLHIAQNLNGLLKTSLFLSLNMKINQMLNRVIACVTKINLVGCFFSWL